MTCGTCSTSGLFIKTSVERIYQSRLSRTRRQRRHLLYSKRIRYSKVGHARIRFHPRLEAPAVEPMPQAAHAGFPGRREVDHGQRCRHTFESSAPSQVSRSRCRGARPGGGLLGRWEFEAVIGTVFAISLIRLLGYLLLVGLLAPKADREVSCDDIPVKQ